MRKLFTTLLILSLLMICVVPCYSQGGRDYQARVLTVSKWLDISGRWFNRVIISFTDGDTTPSIYSSNSFKTGNTAPTTITTFDNAVIGQQIAILFGDANTTIDFSGTNLRGNGGVDWTANQYDILTGVYDGTNWYCEVSNPSVISRDLIVTGGLTIGTGTKHDGYVIRDAVEVQTTDATANVTLDTLILEDENTYHIEALVVGVQSDGTDRASYHIAATVYRTAVGGATIQGTVTSLHTQESNASLDCTITVSSNDARVSVTGIAAETWEWGCTVKYINMSN